MENTKNVYTKLAEARILIQRKNLKKSGYNGFAKFNYYELADFMPAVNEVFAELGLCSQFSIKDGYAELKIFNSAKPEEYMEYTSILPREETNTKTNPIQNIGAMHTYMKRYLYMNALELVENDSVDATIGSDKNDAAANTKKGDPTFMTRLDGCKSILAINDLLADTKGKLTSEEKLLLHNKATKQFNAVFDKDKNYYIAAAA